MPSGRSQECNKNFIIISPAFKFAIFFVTSAGILGLHQRQVPLRGMYADVMGVKGRREGTIENARVAI